MHIGARTVECGTDIGADGSGAEDCDFHRNTPFGRGSTAEVTRRVESCRRNIVYSMEIVRGKGSRSVRGGGDDRSAQPGYRSPHTVDATVFNNPRGSYRPGS
ncbi:hypothetical protein GCM10022207_01210 [Streptomyces lannensis]|uniref:Uncharacterized protein n=1 Tax=Streptomyces lannensis TaxID=766498 RepID=A0ABP7JHT7_9ACTN